MAKRSAKVERERKAALLADALPTAPALTHFDTLCASYAAGADVQDQLADNIVYTFASRQDGGPMFAMVRKALTAAEAHGKNAPPAPMFVSCETDGCYNPVTVTTNTKRYGAYCSECQPELPL